MFNPNEIYCETPGRYMCKCICKSESDAKNIVASFIIGVRQLGFMSEIYQKSNIVYIDTLSEKMTRFIASEINKKLKY